MTKSEFILSLSEALTNMPGQTRKRVLEYFEEMIDDRTESGMSEEEAVAALGSIEDILKDIAPETLNTTHYIEAKTADRNEKYIILREPIDSMIVNSASANLIIRSEELPDGMTARVDFRLSEEAECLCALESGILSVQYKKNEPRKFSFRSFFDRLSESITITLNSPALTRCKIEASSGDVQLSKLVFTESLKVHTASGDLNAHDVAVQCSCNLHTASGDITGKNLTCGELLEVHTASGDSDLFDIRAGKIDAGSASGEPTLSNIECDALNVHSASGDIEVRNLKTAAFSCGTASGDQTAFNIECSGRIEMSSASGDLQIRDVLQAESILLSATSGDIDGQLTPAENYTFRASSRTGDVRVPNTTGPCIAEIRTNSGDIHF